VASLERDLREMLRLQPDSALALNALGYSLTNLTDRHQEALALISRALELQPDDPAILDSMGWVHFRLGENATALGYLRDAYSRFPDHEVAAHLGEVLWVSGQQDEARAIWQKGLEARPDSRIIDEVMRRLGATPTGT
jgi:tetratricopeptide (TPR) repeat protein